jgi:hypothetical protein
MQIHHRHHRLLDYSAAQEYGRQPELKPTAMLGNRIAGLSPNATWKTKDKNYGRQIPEGSPQAGDAEAEQGRQREPKEAAGRSREASRQ